MPRLTKKQQRAIEYFHLDYAKSDEPGAGWFCYQDMFHLHPDYPGSSCECLEDAVRWYEEVKVSPQQDELWTKQ